MAAASVNLHTRRHKPKRWPPRYQLRMRDRAAREKINSMAAHARPPAKPRKYRGHKPEVQSQAPEASINFNVTRSADSQLRRSWTD
ncbi:Hypothetical predicted protein [Pelobates cultripes]|uniref:Uncharacterized protein n=1 Tax=Pelobates cultripes TaxID=61616 RepID=A0AAD1QYS9_PELCU|nr:Hypothetical predicted protein [Pelobates cultripes]